MLFITNGTGFLMHQNKETITVFRLSPFLRHFLEIICQVEHDVAG